jgi:RimJ/RimL family protein N-acetyltransferase
MLKGKKVLLRALKRSDASLFIRWSNDPEVIQYLWLYLPATEIGEEQWIESYSTTIANNNIVFVIEAILDKETLSIGYCGFNDIHYKDQEATLGIAIGEKDYWEKGYGTEAMALLVRYGFEQLNFHRISSSIVEFNERSIGLHKRLGFQQDGRLREATYRNGRFWDYVLFGMLREEYNRLEALGKIVKKTKE